MKNPFPQHKLTDKDRELYPSFLTGYVRMSRILMLDTYTEEDIEKMILLELEGKRRQLILRKLIGRLCGVKRERLIKEVCRA